MVQGLRRVIARQVFAQQLQMILDLRERSIVLRGDSHRQGSEGGSIVLRVRYFPGRQIEVEPRPRSAIRPARELHGPHVLERRAGRGAEASAALVDRKSTRLNSSHVESSYAVFCLKKKK